MYKRLKEHASIFFSPDELGVSDDEAVDLDAASLDAAELHGQGHVLFRGPEELSDPDGSSEDENDGSKGRVQCRICPEKVLRSEEDVTKHLASRGHLVAMKHYRANVAGPHEREALDEEIAELQAALDAKRVAAGGKPRRSKKRKVSESRTATATGGAKRKRKRKGTKKGRNTRIKERKQAEEAARGGSSGESASLTSEARGSTKGSKGARRRRTKTETGSRKGTAKVESRARKKRKKADRG